MFCLPTIKSWTFSSLIEQVLIWVLSAFRKILASLISWSCIQQAALQNCLLFLYFCNLFPNRIMLLRNGVAEIHKQLSTNPPPPPELVLLQLTEHTNHWGSFHGHKMWVVQRAAAPMPWACVPWAEGLPQLTVYLASSLKPQPATESEKLASSLQTKISRV